MAVPDPSVSPLCGLNSEVVTSRKRRLSAVQNASATLHVSPDSFDVSCFVLPLSLTLLSIVNMEVNFATPSSLDSIYSYTHHLRHSASLALFQRVRIRKATASLVMSICLSVRLYQGHFNQTNFCRMLDLRFSLKYVHIRISVKI
jgi:hypothetical protein